MNFRSFDTFGRLYTKVSIATKGLFEIPFPVVFAHIQTLSTVSETVCHELKLVCSESQEMNFSNFACQNFTGQTFL